MRPSLEQLRKILQNEISHDYANRAVIGGLPKLLVFWEPNAQRDGLDDGLVQSLAARIRAYPDLPSSERPAAIQAMLAQIQEAARQPSGPASSRPAEPTPEGPPSQPRTAERPPSRSAPPAEAAEPPPPVSARDEDSGPAQTAAAEEQPSGPPPPPAADQPAPGAAAAGQPAPSQRPTKRGSKRSGKSRGARPAPQPQRRYAGGESMYQSEEPVDPRPRRSVGPKPLRAAEPLNTSAGLDAPLTVLHGVGPERLKLFERLGVSTLHELLLYFPRRYDDYATMKTINRLEYGEECSVIGTVWESHLRKIKGGSANVLKVVLSDSTGMIEVSFFNQPWLAKKLTTGKQVVVSGRVDQYLGRLTLVPEEWEDLDRELLHTGRIVPVYRLTQGLKQRGLRQLSAQVTQFWARRQADPLPAEVVTRAGLMSYGEALAQIHFPDSQTALAAAKHRLAFDELLLLQLGVLRQRRQWQSGRASPLPAPNGGLAAFVDHLPYRLTEAQQRALADISQDLAREIPMNRLLQGDVGSGKTAVAAGAMAQAVRAGAQAVLMAPTSILAEQHFRSLQDLLAPVIGDAASEIRLLQGSTPVSEKEAVYAGLASGAIKAVIGTHALLEAPVEFAHLGLAVVDEQHRFGVAQRAALRGKGTHPHLLVMTATPIPRTLALSVYGDLDLSLLDEMPPGRRPIQTHLLHANERERGYAFVRSQVHKGRQAFFIFPLVEESEKIEARAAVEEHERLQREVFPEFTLGLLHGRMKADEKDEVMTRFRAGEYHILVSTSVVEVGVDVPNATVILIEGANRFGLAQLHQFRGRVGRGEHASYCLLVSDAPNPRADERLLALEQSQDGFVLAEKDLELRGPGDFLGTQQSGFMGLRMAKLSDVKTIETARREAQRLFERDPELRAPEHQALAANLARFWAPGAGDVS